MRRGAKEAGRDPNKLELAPFVAVVPFDDLAMARSLIKPLVSFYIGGMGTYYHALFCRYGFKENADHVRELYNAGDRKRAASEVSDELIDAIAICGPADACRARLADWRKHGAGTALLNLPTGLPPAMTEDFLKTMAPR
jgi:alkanesulfonate monooxygenase SsuD/methylene tetrahydromethanopterin reductase-like flavin-dependent oxidoreductase (luciferase family)